MNNKKLKTILEIVILIICTIYVFQRVEKPYIKNLFGSSDRFINYNNYSNMFEININQETNFILVLNKNYKINHIIFLSTNTKYLYNKNIENIGNNKEIINKIIEILITNNLLKTDSSITITRYGKTYYDKFKNYFTKSLENYNISTNINEKDNTIIGKANELNLEYSTEEDALLKLDYYSKELMSKEKNNINESINNNLDDENAKSYSNNVYKKIEKYVYENKIKDLPKENSNLLITDIPADDNLQYYPDQNSWYYVSDEKLYAYIEFNNNEKIYNFCYNGSIDSIKNGVC